jgi:PLP dependent protein
VLSSAEIRERLGRVRSEVGPDVTVVAATKYVSVDGMAALLEAGVDVVGENRVQDLVAKHAVYGDAFRWHFIGRLQSNKVKHVNRICELVHSLDSHSTAHRLEVPALVQVNLAGEASKGGVSPAEIGDYLRYGILGLSTMPPAAADPEDSRGWFGRLRELAASHSLPELSMGTTQDYRVAAAEGATFVRIGSVLFGESSPQSKADAAERYDPPA